MIAAAMAAGLASSRCAARLAPPEPASGSGQARAQNNLGIPVCDAGAERDLLSSDALQCWFTARHGRWRMLDHQSHLEALVIDVEARDLRDAAEIAQRVVEGPAGARFSEILVYVARPDGRELRVRRVRWTERTGFETLDYSTPPGEKPLTVRSSPSP